MKATDIIDLARDTPELPAHPLITKTAEETLLDRSSLDVATWGSLALREKIAAYSSRRLDNAVDAEAEVTVVPGAREGLFCALWSLLRPGDEVITLGPSPALTATISRMGATPIPVRCDLDWRPDLDALTAAFSDRARVVVLSTPHEHTGQLLDDETLDVLEACCERWGTTIVCDESYHAVIFDGARHHSPLRRPALRSRTLVIDSLSKTYLMTGWRIGYVIGDPELSKKFRAASRLIHSPVPAPLQKIMTPALDLPTRHLEQIAAFYQAQRDDAVDIFESLGCRVVRPAGGVCLLADVSHFTVGVDDLITIFREEAKLLASPLLLKAHENQPARPFIKVCFAKRRDTLKAARVNLTMILPRLSALMRSQ